MRVPNFFSKFFSISPDKSLLKGDYLIDDYDYGKGQDNFDGTLIHFGSSEFKSWREVLAYLVQKQ